MAQSWPWDNQIAVKKKKKKIPQKIILEETYGGEAYRRNLYLTLAEDLVVIGLGTYGF